MERKKFTLDDIEKYLEEIGFIWKCKLIYNPNTDKYKTAQLANFNKEVFIPLKRANREMLMLATISNSTFELKSDNNRLDASDGWFEYLEEKKSKVSV